MKRCDIVVVGLGVVGAAAVWEAARMGARVLGLEARGPTHTCGSSHGGSRIFRQAYWEGECYLPLLRLADHGWRTLQRSSVKRLIIECGGVFIGPRAAGIVESSSRTARAGDVRHECWDASELHRRFPQFCASDELSALYEPGAYAIAAEDARLHMLDQGVSLGAELYYGQTVVSLSAASECVRLITSRGTVFEAGAAIVCGGPWISSLMPELASHVQPHRIPVYWFAPKPGQGRAFDADCFPLFLYQCADGTLLYGLPAGLTTEQGVKIGFHNRQLTPSDPNEQAPPLQASQRSEISTYVARVFGGLEPAPIDAKWCFYTMSADESFVIGTSEASPRIHYASACSGHGFKFAPGIGASLAALARGVKPPVALDAFSRSRFRALEKRRSH